MDRFKLVYHNVFKMCSHDTAYFFVFRFHEQ